MSGYKTVKNDASAEFTEKRSRFIGYCRPVQSVDQANEFISEIKQKHFDARHNVYAYILRDGNIKKYSDDGEPQGTAGIPVLDVLEKSGICDVCVVATRYFGGILLGGGGLVRAYSHTASITLDAADIIEMSACFGCVLKVDYNFYGKLNSIFSDFNVNVFDTDFLEEVNVSFDVKKDLFDSLNKIITDISNGRFSVKKTGEKFVEI